MVIADVPWKVFVVGCGSAGRRWIELCRELGLSVTAYDIQPKMRDAARDLGATMVTDVAAGIRKQPHGVIVATWPRDHIQLALRMVRSNLHVLIEKPLSHNMDGVDDLVTECAQRPHLAAGVVCNLRYHPTTTALKQWLKDKREERIAAVQLQCGSDIKTWRLQQPVADGYGPWLNRGGGVSLDAIHEIDLACHLFGQPERVVGLCRRTGALEGDSDDVASYVLNHKTTQTQIHLDYLQRTYRRRITVLGVNSNVEFKYEQDAAQWRGTYLANLKAWMSAASGSGAVMPNPVSEAAQTLRVALSARKAA